ncbi:MAG TPA: sensor histidine kinase, partial [Ferruginibacter sp.]|nr:sensor histidine kinase [Ferruginibacter sp.]
LLLFASLAGWFLFRGYKRKEKLKLKQLQEEDKIRAAISINRAEENERRRIAADLHDNIGAYASAIRADVEKVLVQDKGENKRSLQNLEQHSLEIINSLRDTIWVLNKENITITGIGDRIKNYINKMQPSYDHIQISLTEEVRKDRRISSQSALSIFRIVQEALHNALKHSRASLVEIILHSDDTAWIRIRDNGGGIESGQTLTEGNGLKNMRTRANEAGFQLHLSSEPGKGTTLLLDIGTTN